MKKNKGEEKHSHAKGRKKKKPYVGSQKEKGQEDGKRAELSPGKKKEENRGAARLTREKVKKGGHRKKKISNTTTEGGGNNSSPRGNKKQKRKRGRDVPAFLYLPGKRTPKRSN